MPFDPDAHLEEIQSTPRAGFDPDMFLDEHVDAGGSRGSAAKERRMRGPDPLAFAKGQAGASEGVLSAVTGIPASVAAGVRGALNLVTANSPIDMASRVVRGESAVDVDPAVDAIQNTQEALTYRPRTAEGEESAAQVAEGMSWLGPKEGRWLGEKAQDMGAPPLLAAALDTGAQVAVPWLAGKGAGAAGRARGGEISPGASPVARTGFENESMGAAAASPDLGNVSAPVREAIQEAAANGSLNRQVLTRHLEADTLPVPVRLTRGQATQDPVQLSAEQNMRGKNPKLAQLFNEQNQQLIENLDEIRREVSPQVVHSDHIQNGQTLIDAYKAADEPIRAQISGLYKQLEEANGGQFPVDGKAFVEAADAALSKKMKGRYVPSQVAGDLADLRDGGPMTFENFENLRTNLAAEARKADRSGDGNAAAAVNIVRESLESLPMTGEAAAIKPIADAARTAAKARFDRLRADPAYRAAVDDSVAMGEHSPLADDFVNKYVVKGKGANIKQMRENLKDDPVAAETISAGAINYLKSKSGVNLFTNEGNFSQAGYNRALQELTPRLPDLVAPEVADQLQALGNVARYTQAQPRGSFVNNSNTFVASAADKAGKALEGIVNYHFGGLPVGTGGRKWFESRKERNFVEKSTEPAAGIRLRDLPKSEKK